MPKKKTTAVTVAKTIPTAVLAAVSLNSTLNMNDVLSIVTSRSETRYQEELKNAKTQLDAANAHRETIKKTLREQYVTEREAAAAPMVASLSPSVEALGGTVKLTKMDSYHIDQLIRNDEGLIVVHVIVKGNDKDCYNTTFHTKVKPSEVFVRLEADLATAEVAIKNAQEVALKWRKKLADIPALERRCRAKLAERKLSETGDGQELLAALTTEIQIEFDND